MLEEIHNTKTDDLQPLPLKFGKSNYQQVRAVVFLDIIIHEDIRDIASKDIRAFT